MATNHLITQYPRSYCKVGSPKQGLSTGLKQHQRHKELVSHPMCKPHPQSPSARNQTPALACCSFPFTPFRAMSSSMMFVRSDWDGQSQAWAEQQGRGEQGRCWGQDVFEAQLDRVQGTAGSRTGRSWITHRGQPKTELMQGKAALRLPKMPLLTNPLQSQLNHSSVPGGWGGNTRDGTKRSDFGHEIPAASLSSPSRAEHLSSASRSIAHTVGKPSSDLSKV